MERRNVLKAAVVVGLTALTQTASADLIVPGRRRPASRPVPQLEEVEVEVPSRSQYFIILELFYTQSKEKRDALVAKFDAELIPLRHQIGFDKVGIFTVNDELMKNERGYDAEKYDGVVFTVQQTKSPELLLNYQAISARTASKFNLEDDLDFIDEEIVALRCFPSVPEIEIPNTNEGRVLQLRTYNSPNYERNLAKEAMFEDAELQIFRNSGMSPVFFGSAIFGSMAPNVTYMLSFKNDEARREGWSKFVNSEEWKSLSKDPKYNRTATRIRNLFLAPSPHSEI